MAVLTASLLWIFEEQIINVFTDMPQVKAFIFPAWGMYMLYVLVDAAQVIGASAVRATGNQGKAAFITSVTYWCVGVPLAWVLCFKCHLDLAGLWMGPIVAVALTFVGYNILFFRVDWEKLIQGMKERRLTD
jgi:MATE family multidrug resistance protein